MVRNGIENLHGVILYYKNGMYHREDGPAKIWPDGTKEWWIKGKIHREDGPAAINECMMIISTKYTWHIEGVKYSFKDWCKKLKKTDEDIVQLKLMYGDLEK